MSWWSEFLDALRGPSSTVIPVPAPVPVPIPVQVTTSPRSINRAGLELITSFEGLRLQSYKDLAGVLTVGWGHTGPDVPPLGRSITKGKAEELLRADLAIFEACVDSSAIGATENQFSAMVCLAFNIGRGGFLKSSVLTLHNKGKVLEAADAFLLWNKAHVNGILTFEPGLLRRRQAEANLYLSPDENSSHITTSA